MLLQQVGRGDELFLHQRAIGAHGHDHLLREHGHVGEVGILVALGAEHHVVAAAQQILHEGYRGVLAHVERDASGSGLVAVEQLGDEVGLHGDDAAEVDLAAVVLHDGDALVYLLEALVHVGEELGAVLREMDVASRLLEQRHAQLLFERADGVRQGRLRDVELFRCLGVMLQLCELAEVVQLRKVHR